MCFQAGRFRRIAAAPELTARSCRALARGTDDRPWFPGAGDEPGLLLGSPGVNDASLQALQACVPDRRVWPAACASVTFSGAAADGAVEIRAVATPARRAGALVPAQARGSLGRPALAGPDLTWNVEAVDASGRVLVTWHGIRLREAGRLSRDAPWPPSLLAAYLERGAARLGLDPALRVTVRLVAGAEPGPPVRVPRPRRAGPPDGLLDGPPDGLVLSAGGAAFAACGWAPADPARPAWPSGQTGQAAAFTRLCGHLPEPPVASAARVQAAVACLAAASAPDAPLDFGRAAEDGWAVLVAGGARLASAVVEIGGLPWPVAVAIMTEAPAAGRPAGAAAPASRVAATG